MHGSRSLVRSGFTALGLIVAGTAAAGGSFVCDYAARVQVGTIHGDVSPFLYEASGLVQSRRQPEVFWSHNDNGGDERLFALLRSGGYLGTYDLAVGMPTRDIEDIAIGPGPTGGLQYVYLADVGHNWGIWGCTTAGSTIGNCAGCVLPNDCRERDLRVSRALEPDVSPQQAYVEVFNHPATTFSFRFPDTSMLGRRQDVEALMIDPLTRDLYFITKRTTPAMVFLAAYPYSNAQLTWVADLPWGGDSQATGADISADGKLIIIRRYGDAFLWQRPLGTSVAEALGGLPCHRTDLSEGQGEAVALDIDGSGSFYTTSEGSGSVPIWLYPTTSSLCAVNSDCDDGLFCNGPESCIAIVGCQPGLPPSCAGQLCSEPLGRCVDCLNDADCSSSTRCGGGGTCEPVSALPILAGDLWRFNPGTTAPPTDWRTATFDDAAWSVGPGGFGYGTDCSSKHGTVLSGMQNNYVTLYLRHTFQVSEPAAIPGLRLVVDYDDSFIAYINGVEVARDNVAGGLPGPTTFANTNHECSDSQTGGSPSRTYNLDTSALVPGLNVLALEGHNLTLNSSDYSLISSLEATTGPDPALQVLLAVSRSGTTTLLTLSSPASGVTYDLASGSIRDLAADRDTNAAQCLMSQSSSGSFSDTRSEPTSGNVYYYVARARSSTQIGSWGSASTRAERNVPACP